MTSVTLLNFLWLMIKEEGGHGLEVGVVLWLQSTEKLLDWARFNTEVEAPWDPLQKLQ